VKNRAVVVLIAAMLVLVVFTACEEKAAESSKADIAVTSSQEQNSTSAPTGLVEGSDILSVDSTAINTQSTSSDSTAVAEKSEKNGTSMSSGFPLTITDMIGNEVKVEKKPENIAVISIELLELFKSAGGVSICAVEAEDGSAEAAFAKSLTKVGTASNPDIFGILELEPDVVFAEAELQNEAVTMLQKNNITVIVLKLDSKESNEKALKLMKEVAGIN